MGEFECERMTVSKVKIFSVLPNNSKYQFNLYISVKKSNLARERQRQKMFVNPFFVSSHKKVFFKSDVFIFLLLFFLLRMTK